MPTNTTSSFRFNRIFLLSAILLPVRKQTLHMRYTFLYQAPQFWHPTTFMGTFAQFLHLPNAKWRLKLLLVPVLSSYFLNFKIISGTAV